MTPGHPVKVIVNSAFLLSKLTALKLTDKQYTEIKIHPGKLKIGQEVEFEIEHLGFGEFIIKNESMKLLLRILNVLPEQPIVLIFSSSSSITINYINV